MKKIFVLVSIVFAMLVFMPMALAQAPTSGEVTGVTVFNATNPVNIASPNISTLSFGNQQGQASFTATTGGTANVQSNSAVQALQPDNTTANSNGNVYTNTSIVNLSGGLSTGLSGMGNLITQANIGPASIGSGGTITLNTNGGFGQTTGIYNFNVSGYLIANGSTNSSSSVSVTPITNGYQSNSSVNSVVTVIATH